MSEPWVTGFIIYKEDYGNSSVRLLFLSLERGLIHLYAKGAKHKNSRIGTCLEYYSLLRLSLVGRFQNYIAQVEVEAVPIKYQGLAIYCAYYLNELIKYTIQVEMHDHAEAQELLVIYKNSLLGLYRAKNNEQIQLTLRRFELQLLQHLGLLYNLTHDNYQQPIVADKYYYLLVEQGLICHDQLPEIKLTTPNNTTHTRNWKANYDSQLAVQNFEQVSDNETIDPLAQQYQEYQYYQLQELQVNSFAGADLLQMHQIFLAEIEEQDSAVTDIVTSLTTSDKELTTNLTHSNTAETTTSTIITSATAMQSPTHADSVTDASTIFDTNTIADINTTVDTENIPSTIGTEQQYHTNDTDTSATTVTTHDTNPTAIPDTQSLGENYTSQVISPTLSNSSATNSIDYLFNLAQTTPEFPALEQLQQLEPISLKEEPSSTISEDEQQQLANLVAQFAQQTELKIRKGKPQSTAKVQQQSQDNLTTTSPSQTTTKSTKKTPLFSRNLEGDIVLQRDSYNKAQLAQIQKKLSDAEWQQFQHCYRKQQAQANLNAFSQYLITEAPADLPQEHTSLSLTTNSDTTTTDIAQDTAQLNITDNWQEFIANDLLMSHPVTTPFTETITPSANINTTDNLTREYQEELTSLTVEEQAIITQLQSYKQQLHATHHDQRVTAAHSISPDPVALFLTCFPGYHHYCQLEQHGHLLHQTKRLTKLYLDSILGSRVLHSRQQMHDYLQLLKMLHTKK